MRRVYLASSWRNPHQPHVVALLRAAGHEVYDFRNPSTGGPPSAVESGFSWREIDEAWERWTPAQYVAAMAHPAAERGFTADFSAMQWCDTCVVLQPCGPSAALEAGWCRGSGRDLIVHVAGIREPELMYKVGRFTLTDGALLAALSAPVSSQSAAPPQGTAHIEHEYTSLVAERLVNELMLRADDAKLGETFEGGHLDGTSSYNAFMFAARQVATLTGVEMPSVAMPPEPHRGWFPMRQTGKRETWRRVTCGGPALSVETTGDGLWYYGYPGDGHREDQCETSREAAMEAMDAHWERLRTRLGV